MLRDTKHPVFGNGAALAHTQASDRIRCLLHSANARYHVNDNVSAFIEEGELQELMAELQDRMQEVLRALVIDTAGDHNSRATAQRFAKMAVGEVFRSRYVTPPVPTDFPNVSGLNEPIFVGPLALRSDCSHHLCPIIDKVWIGVLPNEHSNLIGLSKYASLCDGIMRRRQIQEEAVVVLAATLESRVKPDGVEIVIEADHFCMHGRGVKDEGAAMTSSVMRGAFLKDAALRREFLSLLRRRRG